MSQYHLDYLEQLEAESIHIFREIAAQFEKPARENLAWSVAQLAASGIGEK